MSHELNGKVFFITGASSGIGWALALELASHGARLALCSRRAYLLEELRRLVQKQTDILVFPFDIRSIAEGKSAVSKTLEKWGRVDYLINNAGVINNAHFHDQSFEAIEELTQTNFLGPANLIQTVLPHMLKQGKGHIVNVASICGVLAFPYVASYSASKFALVGLTEALRREYYGTGVTFTAFCPGNVDTPMIAESMKNKRFTKAAKPMAAKKAALMILECCVKSRAEKIAGEVPSLIAKTSKFFPSIADYMVHWIYRKIHPIARQEYLARKRLTIK